MSDEQDGPGSAGGELRHYAFHTTGQNAHAQVETFKTMSPVDALVVTKLDGSAKGGVLVALAEKFRLPVVAVGVGEGIDDLRPFEARAFARGLMGLPA